MKISNHDPKISPIINFTDDVRRAEEAVQHKLSNISIVDAKKAIMRVVNNLKPSFNEDGHLSIYTEVEIGKMLAESYLQKFA